MELHHAPVTFGLIVGEGNAWIVEDSQRVPLARCETQEQVASVAARGRQVDRAWTILARKYELPMLNTASVIKAGGRRGRRRQLCLEQGRRRSRRCGH